MASSSPRRWVSTLALMPGRSARSSAKRRAPSSSSRMISSARTWGDDIKPGTTTDFRRAVIAGDDENIVFSRVTWPSRAARDAANTRIMADPRMAEMTMAFDGKRLIMGGFETGNWPAAG